MLLAPMLDQEMASSAVYCCRQSCCKLLRFSGGCCVVFVLCGRLNVDGVDGSTKANCDFDPVEWNPIRWASTARGLDGQRAQQMTSPEHKQQVFSVRSARRDPPSVSNANDRLTIIIQRRPLHPLHTLFRSFISACWGYNSSDIPTCRGNPISNETPISGTAWWSSASGNLCNHCCCCWHWRFTLQPLRVANDQPDKCGCVGRRDNDGGVKIFRLFGITILTGTEIPTFFRVNGWGTRYIGCTAVSAHSTSSSSTESKRIHLSTVYALASRMYPVSGTYSYSRKARAALAIGEINSTTEAYCISGSARAMARFFFVGERS